MVIAGKTILMARGQPRHRPGAGQRSADQGHEAGVRRHALALGNPDGRVRPLTLDVTSAAQIEEAARTVSSLDILINNAGMALYDDLSDRAALERRLAVNLFGTYVVTQAFLAGLTGSRGALVNHLSTKALAPLPLIPAYSISKAAFNVTQSLRALLADGA